MIKIKKDHFSSKLIWTILLTAFSMVYLFILIGIIAGPDKKPSDIYDVERLPRYSEIKHKFGGDLVENYKRIMRREFYTWINEEGSDTWWCHEYYPDQIKTVSHIKSGEELAYDALYLNGLIKSLNDRSKSFGWQWGWELKKSSFGYRNPSYHIIGNITEKDWLSTSLKDRHEFIVSIYENAAMKTKSYLTVDIVDKGRWLGKVTGDRVDILIGVKKDMTSKKDEDSEEVKEAKSLFNNLVVEHVKVNGRCVVARASIIHDRLVEIQIKEPKDFAAISDDQFKEISRFISLAYAKLSIGSRAGGYILDGMENRKESQSKVIFWYWNISDESLPKFPYRLAESVYTYIMDSKSEVMPVGENLKPPSKCIAEYRQIKSAREAIELGKERFRNMVLKKYKLYGYPIFDEVIFTEKSSNFITFKIHNTRLFDELPTSKIRELFESLGRDYDEIFGSHVRSLLNLSESSFFNQQLVHFEMRGLMKWDKETEDWWVSMGHRSARGEVWENLFCRGSYNITKDGRTPMRCEYWDGKWNEF